MAIAIPRRFSNQCDRSAINGPNEAALPNPISTGAPSARKCTRKAKRSQ